MGFEILNKGWFGSTLGIVGILVAIFFYYNGRKIKRLAYQIRNTYLIGGLNAELPDAVKVTFDNINVPLLAKTTFIIWNDGNTIINGTDLTQNDPLRIELGEGCKILEAKVSISTRPVITFNLTKEQNYPNCLICTFDFIDKNDGVKIEILHTSELEKASLKGTIKELPSGVTYLGKIPHNQKQRNKKNEEAFDKMVYLIFGNRNIVYGAMLIVGLTMILSGLFYPGLFSKLLGIVKLSSEPAFDANKPNSVFIISGMLYTILPLINFWLDRKKFPSKLF